MKPLSFVPLVTLNVHRQNFIRSLLLSSRSLRRADWQKFADVSEVFVPSIFRANDLGNVGKLSDNAE